MSIIELYEFIEDLYLTEGISLVFIDEIHKYPNWSQELKNLYDGFPSLKIIFAGSSSLDLVKGAYDLSRRARLYILQGLSFREYINFTENQNLEVIEHEKLMSDPRSFNAKLSQIHKVKGLFQSYLKLGYYPFGFVKQKTERETYYEKILRVVDKTIYEDIASFYNLKTQNLIVFKRILNYLSSIPPGEFSVHNMAQNMSVDDKTASHYLMILQSTGLLRMMSAFMLGNKILRKPDKVFINNTTLNYALNDALGEPLEIGLVRELFFLQSMQNAKIELYYSAVGDYQTKEMIFEIGGKNKKRKQIKTATLPAILVKDDMMVASKNEIPLYFFGFLY